MKVLQKVSQPIGEVQGEMAVCSEACDCKGVRPNGGEEVLGWGGGIYVPILMQDMNIGITDEQEARIKELWGGDKPKVSGELGPGNGGQFWDSPAGYFIVGVPMLMADRKEVVHNLCVQMEWYTLESLEEPQRMDLLSGVWYVEGVHVRKREELQMVRLMAAVGKEEGTEGIRMMLRPEWVDGVELQMIWGLGAKTAQVMLSAIQKLANTGYSNEWKGEQSLAKTGKSDLLLAEKESWSTRPSVSYRKGRELTDHRKLVIKPLAKHCRGQV